MNESLDRFLPPQQVKPKTPLIYIAETCSKCGTKISINQPKYTLKIKGKENTYCQNCAKKILKPQENMETPI